MGEPQAPREKRPRPRDELGRPLPWDAENLLELEDFDALPLEENHRLGIAHFDAGRFFQAHEAWETAWKQAKGEDDEEFFKGLSQLGAGYVHYRRGNAHGAHTLIRRGLSRIRPYGPSHRGVAVEAVADAAEAHAERFEAAARSDGGLPEVTPPTI
ncbi:MAG TPA: DUF309 domain-containing protein [Actinomycetota bacterium]|nr:DUF309 domain-containing protein [Actinomycetota bacterium]